MHKLREELIKDIITFLDEGNYKTQDINIQNTVTQIIVDTFDEYEVENNIPCSLELDYEFANESI